MHRVYPVCFNEVDDIPFMVTGADQNGRIKFWMTCKNHVQARSTFLEQVGDYVNRNRAGEVTLWRLPAGAENPHPHMTQDMLTCEAIMNFECKSTW